MVYVLSVLLTHCPFLHDHLISLIMLTMEALLVIGAACRWFRLVTECHAAVAETLETVTSSLATE